MFARAVIIFIWLRIALFYNKYTSNITFVGLTQTLRIKTDRQIERVWNVDITFGVLYVLNFHKIMNNSNSINECKTFETPPKLVNRFYEPFSLSFHIINRQIH